MKRFKPVRTVFSVTFQIKFSLLLMLGIALSSLCLFLLVDAHLPQDYAQSMAVLLEIERSFPETVLTIFVFQVLLYLLVFVFPLHLVTHRIAGPLFRIGLKLKSIAARDLTDRMRIRKTDQLQSLEVIVNAKISQLEAPYLALSNLRSALGQHSRLRGPASTHQLKEALHVLEESLQD